MTVARRGDRVLSLDEFKNHVAQATSLEHVGVLLGAGASVACGGMTMNGLWSNFSRKNPDVVTALIDQGFITDPATAGLPNLENVMDLLTIAIADQRRKGEDTSPTISIQNAVLKAILEAAILDEAWLSNPSSSAGDNRLEKHTRLLTRLVHTRQPGQPAPWIFTTNYDMAIELAAESASLHVRDGFRGFHSRSFTPSSFDLGLRNTEALGEAQFGTYEVYLAKLHGSLSWKSTDNGEAEALQIPAAYQRIKEFMDGTKEELESVLIFPSSAKFVDTVGFVYGELMRRLTHFLSRPNVCFFIGGYGFGDNHLNRIILSALNNPTLQLIVYLPEIDGFDGDGLPTNLGALNTNLQSFLQLKLPQISIIGGGASAYFDQLADHLPDPTTIDDPAERARKIANALKDYISTGAV